MIGTLHSEKAFRGAILGLILLAAMLLRMEGLNWGIPQAPYWRSYHPDERVAFSILVNMADQGGSLNPHYFVNPSLHYYLIGLVWWGGRMINLVPSSREIMAEAPSVTLDDVTRIWLLARSVSVILGVLTVWLTYLLGREFFGDKSHALVAAWLAAVMPTLVVQSHYLTVDGPVGFWFLLAIWLMLKAAKKGRAALWATAGLAAGLATATKYNALVGLIPAASAIFFLRDESSGQDKAGLWRSGSAFAGSLSAGFLLGCPYAVLAFGEWKQGLSELLQYNNYPANWLYPWLHISRLSLGWPAWLLFLASLPVIALKRDRVGILLAAAIVPYFVIYGYKASPFMRHMVLIVPLMVLMMVYVLDKAGSCLRRRSCYFITVGLMMLASGYALANSLAWVKVMSGKDTREEAAEYINQKTPKGSDIGLAGQLWFYTPPLEESEYKLIRLEYRPEKLQHFMPRLVVVSEHESKQYAACRVPEEVGNRFFQLLNLRYCPIRTFKRVPQCCGIKFEGYPLADWNYFYPEITIYERSF